MNEWKKTHEDTMVFCECGHAAILVSHFTDESDEIFISMWEGRVSRGTTWSHRLRHIWDILTRGYPYEDDIVISKNDARQLAETLFKYAGGKIPETLSTSS